MTEAELPDTAPSRGEEKIKQRDDASPGMLLHPAASIPAERSSSALPKGSVSEGSKTPAQSADADSTSPSKLSNNVEASKDARYKRHKERQEVRKANGNNIKSGGISSSSSSPKDQKVRRAPGVATFSHGAVRVGASDDGHNNDGDNDLENNLIAAEVAPDVDDLIEIEVQKRVHQALNARQERRQDEEPNSSATTTVAVVVEGNNSNKRLWIALAILGLAVVATIVVVLITQSSQSSTEASVGTDESVSTDAPTTSSPTRDETPSPTPIPVSSYDPPKTAECETMEKGLPRTDADGYQGYLEREFAVVFHAQLSAGSSSTPTLSNNLLVVLEQQIQRLLRPQLVGCTTIGSQNRLDYFIFDLEVSVVQDMDSACVLNGDHQSTQPCHVIEASMNLWLQGDEKDFLIQEFMLQTLEGLDLPATLELEGQFEAIEVQDILLTPAMIRADKVKTILADYSPFDSQTFDWITRTDSWEPDAEDTNHDYLWLERYAMALLWHSTNGASWTNSNNWMTSEPVCKWYMYGNPNECPGPITKLDLWKNNLKGSLPPIIGELSLLTQLYMWDNQLTSSIPSSIGNLSKLTDLWLGDNQLTSIPSSIGNLVKLKALNLANNQLAPSIPSSIGNLRLLEGLWLYNNRLTGSIPSLPSSLTNCMLGNNCFDDFGNGVAAGCSVPSNNASNCA